MSQLQVRLYRDSFSKPWGFRLQGGTDIGYPLTIQRVFSNSPAEGELQRGDQVLSIGGRAGRDLTHQQAQDIAKRGTGQIDLTVYRPAPSRVSTTATFTPAVQRPRAQSLQQPPVQRHPPTMPVSGGGSGFKPKKVTLSRLGGGGPEFGSDFTRYRPSAVTQPVHVHTGPRGPDMMNRVHDSLDNLSLSPRTPDYGYQAPPFASSSPGGGGQYIPTGVRLDMEREQELRQQQLQQQQQQQQQQDYQQPAPPQQQYYFEPQQQPYVATGVRLDHQMGEEEEGVTVQPVSERRRAFMNAPARPAPAPTGKSTAPKVLRPKPGASSFSFGVDYSKPAPKTSSVTWRPQPAQRPVNVPPPQPEPPQAPWMPSGRQEEADEPDVPPAWRTSLRTTGVKPWDKDLEYTAGQQAPAQPRSSGQVQNPDKAGDRDWTQSAVYRMIYEEEHRGRPQPQQAPQQQQQQQQQKPPPPPPAPKPQMQTFQQAFTPMDNEYGTSDF